MRIVGGRWGKRILVSPKGDATRPTSDPHRETIFNVLNSSVPASYSSSVDFFAGTGALGLESMSRGAGTCIFFESDKGALSSLRKNCDLFGLIEEKDLLICTNRSLDSWPSFLKKAQVTHPHFFPLTLGFADPPYGKNLVNELFRQVLHSLPLGEVIDSDFVFVAEEEKEADLSLRDSRFQNLKQKIMGGTRVEFFKIKQKDV